MEKILAFSFFCILSPGFLSAQGTSNYNHPPAEEGTARYYASNLKGRMTSFGEKYDDSQLTASHSRYSLNTILKVTNLENNKSVEVRVNDHCKCEEEGRIINLSKEAASRLGMIATGNAKVRVELISPLPADGPGSARLITSKEESQPQPVESAFESGLQVNHTYNLQGVEQHPKGFGVQVTALSSLKMIEDISEELLKMGVRKEEIFLQVGVKGAGKVFRLMFGEFASKEAASEKLNMLAGNGYKGVVRSHYNL